MLEVKKSATILQRSVKKESELRGGATAIQPEEDGDEIDKCVHWVQSLFPGSVLILCHMKHLVAPYVSKHCKDLLGYDPEQFQSFSPEVFLSLIHSEDIAKVMEGFRAIEDLVQQYPFHKLRFVFQYRLRHKSGHYVDVRDERVTILSPSQRQVFLILLSKVDIDQSNKVSFEALEITRSGRRKITTQLPQPVPFSSREMDVIGLIQRGLSSREIADFLSIAESTVKKHRHSMFKKANVKNSQSLINYAKVIKAI